MNHCPAASGCVTLLEVYEFGDNTFPDEEQGAISWNMDSLESRKPGAEESRGWHSEVRIVAP